MRYVAEVFETTGANETVKAHLLLGVIAPAAGATVVTVEDVSGTVVCDLAAGRDQFLPNFPVSPNESAQFHATVSGTILFVVRG